MSSLRDLPLGIPLAVEWQRYRVLNDRSRMDYEWRMFYEHESREYPDRPVPPQLPDRRCVRCQAPPLTACVTSNGRKAKRLHAARLRGGED